MILDKKDFFKIIEEGICNGKLKKVKLIKKEKLADFLNKNKNIPLTELHKIIEKFSNNIDFVNVETCFGVKKYKNKILNNEYFIYLPSKSEKKFFELLTSKYNNFLNESKNLKNILDYNKSGLIFIEYLCNPHLTPVLLGNNKFYFINITKHALERFIRRLLIIVSTYYNHNNIGKKLQKDYHVLLFLINNYNLDEQKFNYIAKKIMLDYLKKATPFKENKTLYRKSDKKNLKYRKNKYNDEEEIIRIYNFPFLFLINFKKYIIKTTELYSSNLKKLNVLNKITSSNVNLKDFIKYNNIKPKYEYNTRKEEIKSTINKLLTKIIDNNKKEKNEKTSIKKN